MSRYLIVTAISFTAFNAITLATSTAEQAPAQTSLVVAQAPDAGGPPPAEPQAQPPSPPPEQPASPPKVTARTRGTE